MAGLVADLDVLGRRLRGQALGIVGMGRIEHRRRQPGRLWPQHPLFLPPSPAAAVIEDAQGAHYWAELDDMVGEIDIVSLHPAPAGRPTIFSMPND